jgi:hypothetical protein
VFGRSLAVASNAEEAARGYLHKNPGAGATGLEPATCDVTELYDGAVTGTKGSSGLSIAQNCGRPAASDTCWFSIALAKLLPTSGGSLQPDLEGSRRPDVLVLSRTGFRGDL